MSPDAYREVELVGHLLRPAASLMLDVEGSSCWTPELLAQALCSPGVSFGFMEEDALIGLVVTHLCTLNPQMMPDPVLLLRRVVVAPDHRCRGIGRRLLHALCRRIPALQNQTSVKEIAWQVGTTNHASRTFFNHMGFNPRGRLRIGDRVDDIFIESFEDFESVVHERGGK